MRLSVALAAVGVAALASAAPILMATRSVSETVAAAQSAGLRSVASFASIKDKKARSIALFQEAGKVIQSPRCLNCHPAGERPTQTDAMRPHIPLVVRGPDGFGAEGGLRCGTCHHAENFDPAGVPGHPEWHLAPLEMAWQGKTLGQICAQIKDPKRNGGKDMAALIQHVAEDSLVGWGWHPGGARKPVPGTQAEFGALIKAWSESGAFCPS
jgi:hypothetical protein